MTDDGLTVSVKLTPSARRPGIEGVVTEADGQRRLDQTHRQTVRYRRGRVSLAAGAKIRRKRLLIEDDANALARRLSPSAA